MEKNVIVTRIDVNGIQPAKQLFSGLHFNAGWRGDFLLLSHRIPEARLVWFRKRGILIKKCKPLYSVGDWPEYSASKLYIFAEEMKKWERVICLDVDIITRSSLNDLTKIDGFAAVPEAGHKPLYDQFNLRNNKEFLAFRRVEKMLNQFFNLTEVSFNGGVIVFSTNIIKKGTFKKIDKILWNIREISKYADQTALNLFFYKKWKKIPTIYNFHPIYYMTQYNIPSQHISAINLHFYGPKPEFKPWNKKNIFFFEWKNNFLKANAIDRRSIPQPTEVWLKWRIVAYEGYLTFRHLKCISFGNLMKKLHIIILILKFTIKCKYPKIYHSLKKFIRELKINF